MSQALLNHVANSSIKKKAPVLKAGYTVRVHQKIREGDKQRIQVFEGLVIRIGAGNGVNKTFTVRKIVDGIGVEKTYPFFSPNIDRIEVTKAGKVRRSKLYFMRDRTGKSARLKDMPVGDLDTFGAEPAPEVEETPETPETPEEAAPEATEAPEPAEEPEATKEEEAAEAPKEEAPAEEEKAE